MKVLFLHRYGKQAAAYRYRFLQFVPHFKEVGIEITSFSLLPDAYLDNKFKTGKTSWTLTAKSYLNRFRQLVTSKDFDLIVIFKEVFPHIPFFFEKLLIGSKTPYILDYDDAIFHSYESSRNPIKKIFLKDKFKKLIQNSKAVVAGSQYLGNYAKNLGANTHVVPTVVDLNRYSVQKEFPENRFENFNIGWIGAPTSAQFIAPALEALETLKKESGIEVTFVGSGNRSEFTNLNPSIEPWTEETEIAQLLRFDVGIMPLTDDPWCMGKCGFKLIQYMACGLPVIASPIGANREIVNPDSNGFLANTTSEWIETIRKLRNNPALCQRLGSQGRKDVVKHYSVEAVVDKLIAIYRSAV